MNLSVFIFFQDSLLFFSWIVNASIDLRIRSNARRRLAKFYSICQDPDTVPRHQKGGNGPQVAMEVDHWETHPVFWDFLWQCLIG